MCFVSIQWGWLLKEVRFLQELVRQRAQVGKITYKKLYVFHKVKETQFCAGYGKQEYANTIADDIQRCICIYIYIYTETLYLEIKSFNWCTA